VKLSISNSYLSSSITPKTNPIEYLFLATFKLNLFE